MSRSCTPTIRPFEAVGNRTNQKPLTFGKASGNVQSRTLRVAARLDARDRICEYITLLDQSAEHRRQHRQRVGGGSRCQWRIERSLSGVNYNFRRRQLKLPPYAATAADAVGFAPAAFAR
jgi:hypothetical protein